MSERDHDNLASCLKAIGLLIEEQPAWEALGLRARAGRLFDGPASGDDTQVASVGDFQAGLAAHIRAKVPSRPDMSWVGLSCATYSLYGIWEASIVVEQRPLVSAAIANVRLRPQGPPVAVLLGFRSDNHLDIEDFGANVVGYASKNFPHEGVAGLAILNEARQEIGLPSELCSPWTTRGRMLCA